MTLSSEKQINALAKKKSLIGSATGSNLVKLSGDYIVVI